MIESDSHINRQRLDPVNGNAGVGDTAAIHEVANQFESLFLQMMLKSMRTASVESDLLNNNTTDQYRDLMDSQLAIYLSSTRSVGIASTIEEQLNGTNQVHQSFNNSGVFVNNGSTKYSSMNGGAKQFIDDIWPLAKLAGQQLEIDPRAIVAQAALETGWGGNVIANNDGNNSHNIFGIKASPEWTGNRVSRVTREYENGQFKNRVESFRSYASYADAFDDYVRLLKTPRYSDNLANLENSASFGDVLQGSGYATDPAYGEKIRNILNSQNLEKLTTDINK
jgi:peptidoglycan hydrolase FlgJ